MTIIMLGSRNAVSVVDVCVKVKKSGKNGGKVSMGVGGLIPIGAQNAMMPCS